MLGWIIELLRPKKKPRVITNIIGGIEIYNTDDVYTLKRKYNIIIMKELLKTQRFLKGVGGMR